ncbi:MAG TPA: NAD(P)H-hydrate epimerase [Kineosporiaceae bacterium]|nr:NAD(P)H-hydrate epimerase [Kineosporiaceae bacterium]
MSATGTDGWERAWGVEAVRAAEDDLLARTPEGALMQRAAAGLATVCARELRERRGRLAGARAVLLVGAGNNGGDALWAGARLARRGVRVTAVRLAANVHPEGLAALRAAGGRVTEPSAAEPLLRDADLVVDGIVGIGGSAGLREPAASLVAALTDRGTAGAPLVVAVDLPSGVDPDTGATPAAYVTADVTVTFGAPKPCLVLPPGDRAAGRVEVVDIGLLPGLRAGGPPAVERLTGGGAAALWPVPTPEDDKYRRGVVGVVAGSSAYTGAAVLCVGGALRAGTGMVRYVGPEHAADHVRQAWPEVVVGTGRVQAYVLGSGVDPDADDGQADHIRDALRSGLPCVVDAGALALLGDEPDLRRALGVHTVLTPHAGELARLLAAVRGGEEIPRSEVEAAPAAHARELAEATGATVLLKGSTTLVVPGDGGPLRSVRRAPSWLATAGAGDVLAGILGALLGAGLAPADAAALAADVHGRAATVAAGPDPGGPILAGDVAATVPAAVRALLATD